MNNFQNEASYRIWKLIEFQAKHNIKTPLCLFSLLINVDSSITKEEDLQLEY